MIGSGLGRHPVNVHLFGNNHVFYFGAQSTSNTATFECGIDGSSIIVGEDCMFSSGIHARTHDHHSIVDMDTGASINPPGDIIFEPHVWVGQDAVIMKSVRVGFGAVIATRAVVTRDVPRQSIVVVYQRRYSGPMSVGYDSERLALTLLRGFEDWLFTMIAELSRRTSCASTQRTSALQRSKGSSVDSGIYRMFL